MRIGFSTSALLLVSLIYGGMAISDSATPSYELQIGFTGARLKGVTLGDDSPDL